MNHEYLDAIQSSFPNGHHFTTDDAGKVIAERFNKNHSTAVVYASQTLRELMDIQQHCPESDQLRRVNRRYVFVPSEE